MNELRQAAEQALKYFEDAHGLEDAEVAIREALRQALNSTKFLPEEMDAYERGFIEGRQDQMRSTVEKAVNAMTEREWTDEELDAHSRKMLIDLKKQMKCTDEEAVVRAVENMKREGWFDPETKPVAWRNTQTGEFCTGGFLEKVWDHWTPLYAAPPKREWVGLTDEERADCWSSSAVESAINIEQALKEKNT